MVEETRTTTPLRPHQVLGTTGHGGDLHALTLTSGPFAGIIFSYDRVEFEEIAEDNEDKLRLKFEYNVHQVPEELNDYDKITFEEELGDFLVELLYYGFERDKLGFIDGEDADKGMPKSNVS